MMELPDWILRPRVAVLEIHGAMGGPVRSQGFVPLIRRLRESKLVGAVVLDIDSPGGSVTVADYIHLELQKLAARKPLVAFVRGVGASGGYWVACAARRIFAVPSAAVGSIGVLAIRPEAVELLEKVGVRVQVHTTGALKGMNLPFRPVTPEEERKNEELVRSILERFVDVVASGRALPSERVRELATGEVFLAAQARELGLVDELGSLEDAVASAARLAGIRERSFTVRPRHGVVARLAERFGAAATRAAVRELAALSRLQPRV